jgi:exodeoxyribonuclease VII large subunit
VNPQTISVTEFVSIINETLAFAYPQVLIEGEVSSFKVNQGKFVFFDLKDEANVLNCFMMVHQLKMPIEDGMKVRVLGSPKVTKFSKFSLTVRDVELAGEGALRRAMELLKKKLEGEGLFDPARKRPIPAFPTRLGLITSGASAAYADFIKILSARWGGIEVLLADVSVQGAQAPDQIVGALEYFNTLRDPVDVLVLIRGGGSLEDLAAFSTEPVARAVAASRTPIIVGVGHEVDFSLADYAADLRAATPTDAARLVVPDRHETEATIEHLARRISHVPTSMPILAASKPTSATPANASAPLKPLSGAASTVSLTPCAPARKPSLSTNTASPASSASCSASARAASPASSASCTATTPKPFSAAVTPSLAPAAASSATPPTSPQVPPSMYSSPRVDSTPRSPPSPHLLKLLRFCMHIFCK